MPWRAAAESGKSLQAKSRQLTKQNLVPSAGKVRKPNHEIGGGCQAREKLPSRIPPTNKTKAAAKRGKSSQTKS